MEFNSLFICVFKQSLKKNYNFLINNLSKKVDEKFLMHIFLIFTKLKFLKKNPKIRKMKIKQLNIFRRLILRMKASLEPFRLPYRIFKARSQKLCFLIKIVYELKVF